MRFFTAAVKAGPDEGCERPTGRGCGMYFAHHGISEGRQREIPVIVPIPEPLTADYFKSILPLRDGRVLLHERRRELRAAAHG